MDTIILSWRRKLESRMERRDTKKKPAIHLTLRIASNTKKEPAMYLRSAALSRHHHLRFAVSSHRLRLTFLPSLLPGDVLYQMR